MTHSRPDRRLAAILAADVAGYSRLIGADEAGTVAAMKRVWAECVNPAIATHRGRIVKLMGDGVLAEFASAVDAVDCAVAIQRGMAALNSSRPGAEALELRIGVNLGDIVIDGDDILGDGVNVAARLEGKAPTGGVLVSDAVHAQVSGKTEITFADAGELSLKNIAHPVRAWRWTTGGSVAAEAVKGTQDADIPSIAVLPFANMSGDPEQEHFADGLVEDIITTLSKLAGLRVIARNSSFVYKGQAVDIRDVAAKLGVQYVLEGSVRRGGSRIRITAQLIDAVTGSHVWAERYDRSIDDIFAVQDEITLVLATEMQVKLTEGEQARIHYNTTTNVEAWTYWVQGLTHFRESVTRENTGKAMACWEKALSLDPRSAVLNARLGFMYYVDARFGWRGSREARLNKAIEFTGRAMELDPENADANISTAFTRLWSRKFDEAAAFARRATELAPGSAEVVSLACFVLAFAGYPQEAVQHGERAMQLSPTHPGYHLGQLGNAYRLVGRTEEAIAAFKAYHARAPGFGLVDLVLTYGRSGRPEEAARMAAKLMSIRHDFTISRWAETQIRADAGALEADLAALRAAGLPEG